MNCNICGKEFDKKDLIIKKSDDGTEYGICAQCETEGVEISETAGYYICRQCGYPHKKDEFTKKCKFCNQIKNFEKIELTEVEEELLNADPQKLYKEKLGKASAQKIAEWIESPERKEVGMRHKRDRLIDTATLVGLLLTYVLLEINIGNYINKKLMCVTLLIPTILILICAPVFKKMDKKPRKKPLPIWSIYVVMALLTDIYILIAKIFA